MLPRIGELQQQEKSSDIWIQGTTLKDANAMPITANAYLGGWGITRALTEGADIVVGGRLADASLVAGPSAWKFGWKEDDWDQIAGAYAAGHIIECGAQARAEIILSSKKSPVLKMWDIRLLKCMQTVRLSSPSIPEQADWCPWERLRLSFYMK